MNHPDVAVADAPVDQFTQDVLPVWTQHSADMYKVYRHVAMRSLAVAEAFQ